MIVAYLNVLYLRYSIFTLFIITIKINVITISFLVLAPCEFSELSCDLPDGGLMCPFPDQICDRKAICPDGWDEENCGKLIK